MYSAGLKLDERRMKDFSAFFKDQAAKKKFITDDDITALYEKWMSR
jgi:isopropylmalate/homocitrate/citramalate synthase